MKLSAWTPAIPTKFTDWEQFWDTYLAQQLNFIKHAFIQQQIVINLRPKHFAVPMASAMHDLCMKSCTDLHAPKIEGGIDLGYFECIGYGTVVDSLAAIKKLVFEEKKLTLAEIIEALEVNFEGKEDIRAMLRNAPCYGNNDPYADSIAKAIDRESVKFTQKYSKELGVHLDLRWFPSPLTCPSAR
jgi:pyruvate-formate lyase